MGSFAFCHATPVEKQALSRVSPSAANRSSSSVTRHQFGFRGEGFRASDVPVLSDTGMLTGSQARPQQEASQAHHSGVKDSWIKDEATESHAEVCFRSAVSACSGSGPCAFLALGACLRNLRAALSAKPEAARHRNPNPENRQSPRQQLDMQQSCQKKVLVLALKLAGSAAGHPPPPRFLRLQRRVRRSLRRAAPRRPEVGSGVQGLAGVV